MGDLQKRLRVRRKCDIASGLKQLPFFTLGVANMRMLLFEGSLAHGFSFFEIEWNNANQGPFSVLMQSNMPERSATHDDGLGPVSMRLSKAIHLVILKKEET